MPNEWSDPARVEDYLAREIPHRDSAELLLAQALPSPVEHVLDLGTGDGRLLALIRREHPRARGVGLDASEPILTRARARFAQQQDVVLAEHDLADPLSQLTAIADLPALDAVVSGLAIHHLEHERKRSLFAEVHALLRPGGVFANLDLTASPTPALHDLFRQAIGRVEDDPADRLADACDQLAWLREAGFATADCRFKWLELTLLIAQRR